MNQFPPSKHPREPQGTPRGGLGQQKNSPSD